MDFNLWKMSRDTAGAMALIYQMQETDFAVDCSAKATGEIPLHLAVMSQMEYVVQTMLQRHPYSAEIVNSSGYTALHEAVQGGNERIVRMLLKAKPDLINRVDITNEWTPLHLAAIDGNEEIFRILSEAQPSLKERKSSSGELPIHIAAASGCVITYKNLAGDNAANSAKTVNGFTPLDLAAQNNHYKIALIASNESLKAALKPFGCQEQRPNILAFLNGALGFLEDQISKDPQNKDLYFKKANLLMILDRKEEMMQASAKGMDLLNKIYKKSPEPFSTTNKEKVNDLRLWLNESNDQIESAEITDRAIIIMGKRGVGKSALVHTMTKISLFALRDEDSGDVFIDTSISLGKLSITHGPRNDPSIPASITHNGITIWDMPGFHQKDDIVQKVINSFAIKKVLEETRHAKFVLTLSYSSLDNSQTIIESLDPFLASFTDIKSIGPSLSLVVTKVPSNKSLNNIKSKLESMLDSKDFSPAMQSIFKSLINSLYLFYEPSKDVTNLPESKLFEEILNHGQFADISPSLANIKMSNNQPEELKTRLAEIRHSLEEMTYAITRYISKFHDAPQTSTHNLINDYEQLVLGHLTGSMLISDRNINIKNDTNGWNNIENLYRLSKVKIESGNLDQIKSTMTSLLDICQKFAANEDIRGKLEHFSKLFQSQVKYAQFFEELCSDTYDYKDIKTELGTYHTIICYHLRNSVLSLHLNLDENRDSIEYYQQALKYLGLYDNEPQSKLLAAKCYEKLANLSEDPDLAIQYSLKSLKIDNKNEPLYQKLATLEFSRQNYEKAMVYFKAIYDVMGVEACYKALLELNPSSSDLFERTADYYSSIGWGLKAIEYYDRASSLAIGNQQKRSDLLHKKADVMRKQNDPNTANEWGLKAANHTFCEYISQDNLDAELALLGDIVMMSS